MQFANMGCPNYQDMNDDQHHFCNDLQLTSLDYSSSSNNCSFVAWDYFEFGLQQTSDVSLLDMVLSDPYYAPNFSLLHDQAGGASEFGGVWNDGITDEGQSRDFEEQKMQIDEQGKVLEKKKLNSKKRSTSKSKKLSRETISQHFYLPIAKAAKAMNVGLTHLKKRCRELCIKRWPRRKLISLQTLINNVQEMGGEEEREAVKSLEREKELVEKMPDMELQVETKRLRQASFKSNYKRKQLMQEIDQTFCELEGDQFVSFILADL